VVLLAVSIDEPKGQAKLPAFLKDHGLHCKVLLGGPDNLPGYEYIAASSLFLIDRKGILAGVPGDFYYHMREELERRLPDLIAGSPSQGTLLWSLRVAPQGFGEIWRRPLEEAPIAMIVAPARAGHSSEIALHNESGAAIYSPSGERISSFNFDGENEALVAGADLDGDGMNEWILTGDHYIRVVDVQGQMYWRSSYYEEYPQIAGVSDLDGDGGLEIIVRSGDRVDALRPIPSRLWSNEGLHGVMSVAVDPHGTVEVQIEGGIQVLDRRGNPKGPPRRVPIPAYYRGKLERSQGGPLRVFGTRYYDSADFSHDLDGDGRKDLLVPSYAGLSVYSAEGTPLLIMETLESQTMLLSALVHVDGRQDDELVVYVPNYGMVALGVSSIPPPSGHISGVDELNSNHRFQLEVTATVLK
jgi:hypothetical protein